MIDILSTPPGIQMPVPNHGGAMSDHLGEIMHSQEGNGSVFGEFSNPASQASYHRWISKTGRIEWYVDLALESWAQIKGNSTYLSLGFEGFVAEPLTEAQLNSGALCLAYDSRRFGFPLSLAEAPGQKGFGWHGMGCKDDWGHCVCPGPTRRGQRQDILKRAAVLLAGPAIGTPPVLKGVDMRNVFVVATPDVDPAHPGTVLSAYAFGADGNLFTCWQLAPGGNWSAWMQIGGEFPSK